MGQQLYTTKELAEMSAEDLRVAQANGFVKPQNATEADIQHDVALNRDGFVKPGPAARLLEYPHVLDDSHNEVAFKPAPPSSPQDPYAVTSWGSPYYDFVTPSGQTCQMQKLKPELLIGTGILDKITRLPALADDQVSKAEGKPPVAQKMPSTEDLSSLLDVLQTLLPLVVVQPHILPDPKPDATGEVKGKTPGVIYVSDIDLADQVAIMERAVGGVRAMDNFRE